MGINSLASPSIIFLTNRLFQIFRTSTPLLSFFFHSLHAEAPGILYISPCLCILNDLNSLRQSSFVTCGLFIMVQNPMAGAGGCSHNHNRASQSWTQPRRIAVLIFTSTPPPPPTSPKEHYPQYTAHFSSPNSIVRSEEAERTKHRVSTQYAF